MNEIQPQLFANDFDQTPNFHPVDPHVAASDIPRLSAQSAAILDRLKQGPATNFELSRIALRYSARIHDLKKAGFKVSSKQVAGAEWIFELEASK